MRGKLPYTKTVVFRRVCSSDGIVLPILDENEKEEDDAKTGVSILDIFFE